MSEKPKNLIQKPIGTAIVTSCNCDVCRGLALMDAAVDQEANLTQHIFENDPEIMQKVRQNPNEITGIPVSLDQLRDSAFTAMLHGIAFAMSAQGMPYHVFEEKMLGIYDMFQSRINEGKQAERPKSGPWSQKQAQDRRTSEVKKAAMSNFNKILKNAPKSKPEGEEDDDV